MSWFRSLKARVRVALLHPNIYAIFGLMYGISIRPASAAAACGGWSAGFQQLILGLGAFGDFFYGPFFKFGCLGAAVVGGVVLLFDDGQLGRIAQYVLRTICVIGFILGVASMITTPAANCAPATT